MAAGDANPENNTRQPALPPRAAAGLAHGGQPHPSHGGQRHPSWLASNGQQSDRTLVSTTGSGLSVADTLKSGSCTGVLELNLVQEGFGNLQKYSTRHLACSSKQARGGNDQLCFLSAEASRENAGCTSNPAPIHPLLSGLGLPVSVASLAAKLHQERGWSGWANKQWATLKCPELCTAVAQPPPTAASADRSVPKLHSALETSPTRGRSSGTQASRSWHRKYATRGHEPLQRKHMSTWNL